MQFVILFFCIINFVFLIGIGLFIVRSKDRYDKILSELINVLGNAPIVVPNSNENNKTWDQKYEEELDFHMRRLRADSGLVNLPDPTVSWGEPPAPKKIDNLNIQDK